MFRSLIGRGRSLRAKASLLLAVFLSAGTSLPSLDAVLYHRHSSHPERARTHLDVAGGCLHHAEHCTLGRTAPGSNAIAGLAGPVRAKAIRRSPSYRPAPQPIVDLDRSGIPQPRAPPAPLA